MEGKWKQGSYKHGPQPSVTYQLSHLQQKPLRYFSNVGYKHEGVRRDNINAIKRICGFRLANGIEFLTYYYLGRVRFPFHCQWLKERGCELSVFDPGGCTIIWSRIIKVTKGQRIPKKDLDELGTVLKEQSDLIHSALREIYNKPENK
jgi:hypothetical protein